MMDPLSPLVEEEGDVFDTAIIWSGHLLPEIESHKGPEKIKNKTYLNNSYQGDVGREV